MKIAIIDDSPAELDSIKRALATTSIPTLKHLEVDYFTQSNALIEQLSHYQLFILDWYIDNKSGLDLLSLIRAQCEPNTAVIMVTTNNKEEDICTALIKGADDYLVKPFRAMELCARLYNVIRRYLPQPTAQPDEHLHIGCFSFNDQALEVRREDTSIKMAPREYAIARYLFSHLGEPISRKTLYQKFWEKEETYHSRSLDTHIYRIRTRLGLTVEHGWQLHTIYGFGYRLEPIHTLTSS
ncbi:response regulator transcription factor [Denitrificimonas sp. JX-1]|uniref:Response regulator transcription factor n=1 Tax=Denitrificimonas halotolerans TaxID=3098930 RepID=A0ABU5GSA8_9GAMM|nr:response regulator transcription factor [Denitrificimonas sp. JX-1]MDY7219392.1 response regulator transcription factor [Denitrificimonas sp. JX-1]